MALNAYLALKGAKQGPIKGGVTQKSREGQILVFAMHHEIVSPRDAASGQATGKRMHKPLIITKEIDRSTPLLYTALVNNETITEFILTFWGMSSTGKELENYIIKLSNAYISDIADDMLNNKIEPGNHLPVIEQVSFTYEKIEWTWVNGDITSSDNWVVS